MKRFAILSALAAGCLTLAACNADREPPSTTRLAEPSGEIDSALMSALLQAKNYHHKAKLFAESGDHVAAIDSVRQILSLKFPANAPEAEDVRADARALLAKLLVGDGKLDDAMRTVDEGIAASTRDSFFVANLYTVKGEILEARASARGSDAAAAAAATDDKHAALTAYDKSIQINAALQQRLMEER